MPKTDLQFIVLLAGKSTRNYPHSKGLPHKALLPLGDFKVIDHIVQKILSAGGKDIAFIISEAEDIKHFENCFKPEPYIEEKFESKGDLNRLSLLKKCYLPENIKIQYVIQKMPLGVGHAIALASKENQNVYVVFPDDIIISKTKHPFVRAVEEYEKTKNGNIIITRTVDDPSRWGIIENGVYVEKPKNSTSNEAVISSMILDKAVVKHLKNALFSLENGENPAGMYGNELTQIHALNLETQKHDFQKIRTIPLDPTDIYLDCGTIDGYEKALLYTLLNNSIFSTENKKWLDKC